MSRPMVFQLLQAVRADTKNAWRGVAFQALDPAGADLLSRRAYGPTSPTQTLLSGYAKGHQGIGVAHDAGIVKNES